VKTSLISTKIPNLSIAIPEPVPAIAPAAVQTRTMGSSKNVALHFYGLNLTTSGETIQFMVLSSAYLLFMVLYGYSQEIVVYQWFKRTQSLFTTLLYFFGMSLCTVTEKALVWSTSTETTERRTPWMYHLLMSVCKVASQMLSNMSMTEINYPAKTLFKSAMPCATIFIGTFILRKKYPIRDYVVVMLLVIGIYIFISGNSKQPEASSYGILLVVTSLVMAAAIPMFQEYCMSTYHSDPKEMVFYSSIGGCLLCVLITTFTGDLMKGLVFVFYGDGSIEDHSVNPFVAICLFGTTAFLGAQCSASLTRHFGALSTGILSTTRKILTLVLSFALFPERNILHVQHVCGLIVFFSGICLRVFGQATGKKSRLRSRSCDEIVVDEGEEDDSQGLLPIFVEDSVMSTCAASGIERTNSPKGFRSRVNAHFA
jgi:solute carrier family 35 (adenosine 3'-phospho 5'-phosphosulfate transporter), member B3